MPRRLTRSDTCRTVLTPCVLCPKEKGALKPVKRDPGPSTDGGNQEFVHLFCSLWRPGFHVEDVEAMEPVTTIVDTQENQSKLVCSLCKVTHGACIRCSHGMYSYIITLVLKLSYIDHHSPNTLIVIHMSFYFKIFVVLITTLRVTVQFLTFFSFC